MGYITTYKAKRPTDYTFCWQDKLFSPIFPTDHAFQSTKTPCLVLMIYSPVTPLSETHQDTLPLTLQNIWGQHFRPLQQVVWVIIYNMSWSLHLSLAMALTVHLCSDCTKHILIHYRSKRGLNVQTCMLSEIQVFEYQHVYNLLSQSIPIPLEMVRSSITTGPARLDKCVLKQNRGVKWSEKVKTTAVLKSWCY